jgi:glutamate-ammonia-ligase adenylyltransferase
MKYGHANPELRATNTWEALNSMQRFGLLDETQSEALRGGYGFLRLVESRLRMVHNRAMDEVPESQDEMEKLARRLGFEPQGENTPAEHFLEELDTTTTKIRKTFNSLVDRERLSSAPC